MPHLLPAITFVMLLFSQLTLATELTSKDASSFWAQGQLEKIQLSPINEFLSFKTSGDGSPSLMGWDLAQPVDMSKHYVRLMMKISSLEAWSGIELRFYDTATSESYASIRIPKYEYASFNWLQPGPWSAVTLSMGEMEMVGSPDIKSIRRVAFYISDTGTAQAPQIFEVGFSAMQLVPLYGKSLVSLTFDDGKAEHLIAAEIMFRYGLRGTAYIMPNAIGKEHFLSLNDLNLLYNKYQWGISSHHEFPYTDMSAGVLQAEITNTLSYLNSLGFALSSEHVAYPLGQIDSDLVLPTTAQYFLTGRVANGGAETFPPADWKRLRVINVTPSVTPEIIEERLQKAKLYNEWVILMFHNIVTGAPQSDLEYNIDELEKVLKFVKESEIPALPVHEVWEIYHAL